MWSHEEIHFSPWPHSWPSCDTSHYLLLQQIAALGKASYFFHKAGNWKAQIELIPFGNHSLLELHPSLIPACSHKSTRNQGCNSCPCSPCSTRSGATLGCVPQEEKCNIKGGHDCFRSPLPHSMVLKETPTYRKGAHNLNKGKVHE